MAVDLRLDTVEPAKGGAMPTGFEIVRPVESRARISALMAIARSRMRWRIASSGSCGWGSVLVFLIGYSFASLVVR